MRAVTDHTDVSVTDIHYLTNLFETVAPLLHVRTCAVALTRIKDPRGWTLLGGHVAATAAREVDFDGVGGASFLARFQV